MQKVENGEWPKGNAGDRRLRTGATEITARESEDPPPRTAALF
jgi:hypothetical protein